VTRPPDDHGPATAGNADGPPELAALETHLRDYLADLLRLPGPAVDTRQPLTTLGLDSLNVVDLQCHVSGAFGFELDPELFFEDVSIADLAARIAAAGPPLAPRPPDGAVARRAPAAAERRRQSAAPARRSDVRSDRVQFSLFYFSSDEAEVGEAKYQLLTEGARFADRNGFAAVWVPERHFHGFGGLYPNPSVLCAALAMVTERVRLRAGSVVLPLHHPARVAEEWAVVDNLSRGRVDIAFAAGWNRDDFTLAPAAFAGRTGPLFPAIQTVRRLWRGEEIATRDGAGEPTRIRIYPRPRQPELRFWITCSGGEERFVEAGSVGANVLTALLFQSVDELAAKLALYRQARARHGFDPDAGQVTVMLHTFVGTDPAGVLAAAREPFTRYLAASVDLWRRGAPRLESLSEAERAALLGYAFERYVRTSALIGTPESCLPMVRRLEAVGVDEIACLIDFGVETGAVMRGLRSLRALKELANDRQPPADRRAPRPARAGTGGRAQGWAPVDPDPGRSPTGGAHPTPSRRPDLRAEAALDDDFPARVAPTAFPRSPAHVLLTGATGFLGAFLLDELLRSTEATVHCLVRSPDPAAALGRIRQNLMSYRLWREELAARIAPVPGDLSRHGLGLPTKEFDALSERVEVVYHAAAQMSFLDPYASLRAVNVRGTAEVLRFAVRGRVKPLHHVSTASVFDARSYARRLISELDEPDDPEGLVIGYAQSKWVAEKLVVGAGARGLPVAIYRPAWIAGHSRSGVCNDDDFLSRLIKGCLQLGAAPRIDYDWNIAPVDYVSRAIVELSRRPETLGEVLHLTNPRQIAWRRLVALIGQAGYDVRPVPYRSWRSQLLGLDGASGNALQPLLPLFLRPPPSERRTLPQLYRRSLMPTLGCQRTQALLAGTSITCPPVDAVLLGTYLSHWVRSGFLAGRAAVGFETADG
jgi:natural product biosynthesis luciferase-like monooxygenase protein/thioester reductase-like protein